MTENPYYFKINKKVPTWNKAEVILCLLKDFLQKLDIEHVDGLKYYE